MTLCKICKRKTPPEKVKCYCLPDDLCVCVECYEKR